MLIGVNNIEIFWLTALMMSKQTENQKKLTEIYNFDSEKVKITIDESTKKIPNTIPNDTFIFVKDDALDADLCKRLIKIFDSHESKNRGMVTDGSVGGSRIDLSLKVTTEMSVSHSMKLLDVDKLVFESLSRGFSDYFINVYNNNPLYMTPFYNGKLFDTGFHIQKYEKNSGFYGWHTDELVTENSIRRFAFIFYLNTVIEGGETMFLNGKVNPVRGRLLFFPSTWTYLHRGNVPISNDKYILTGWMNVPIS